MVPKKVFLLNVRRRALRRLLVKNAQLYAETSGKLVKELEKLSKDDLGAFLKKNPDALFDVGGGIAAQLSLKAKTAGANILQELGKDFRSVKTKGLKRASVARARLEEKALAYLKKTLSL